MKFEEIFKGFWKVFTGVFFGRDLGSLEGVKGLVKDRRWAEILKLETWFERDEEQPVFVKIVQF